jgi:arylsulfatase A-like enzyme/Tfp pilus assembly protein PilF
MLHSLLPMRVLRWLFLLLLVGSGSGATQPSKPVSSNHPNIILITLDTTRADRMGFLGSTRGLTPNLDALAKQAVVFTRAFAQVPLTTPSHAALLSGTYPQYNHVEDLGSPLGKDVPYLPDILRRHGYHTAGFIGAYILDPKSQSAPGFDRGFDTYDAGFHRRKPGEDRYASVERRAGEVVDHALAWLQAHPRDPFFVWLHFYDAHDPYDPPSPFKEKYVSAPYDGEIAYTDSQVGRFLAALRTKNLYSGSMIVIAADHGEAFGEHGEERHGMFLYDETVHVPLLMKLPNERMAGTEIDSRVALADVAPSTLQAVGLPVPSTMQGEALLGSTAADHPVYSETDYPRRAFSWSALRSWRAGKYLYVQAPKRELYDQSSDPEAQRNLAPQSTAVADTLQGQMNQFRAKTSAAKKGSTKLDPAQIENLRALGYLASDTNQDEDTREPGGVDPKDKIQVANQMHEALVDIEEEKYEDAIPRFEKVIQAEPATSSAYLELGRALFHTKRYQEALPYLHTAVEKMPSSGMAHYELGLTLVKTGQWEASLAEFQSAVEKTPKSAQLHFYLGAVYTRLKRVPEGMQEFRKTLELDPNHYLANLLYGRLLFLERRPQEALPKLQLAAKLEPDFREPHAYLADLYSVMGQTQKAAKERVLAAKGRPGEVP